MTTEIIDKTALLRTINEPVTQLVSLISALDENKVNAVPYADSWTAGQLLDHVIKSTGGIAELMRIPGKQAGRDPGEKIEELKKVFLDFSLKMKSPGMIVPGAGPFKKQVVIRKLGSSFERLEENTKNANLSELVQNFPGGEVTKLELLHFVLYHTQRHLHQMNKICEALTNN